MPIGDSEKLVDGDPVLAIGNADSAEVIASRRATVSAKGRVIGQSHQDDFSRTDACLKLVIKLGRTAREYAGAEVVGINSNIISNSGGSMGIRLSESVPRT